ncbi:hypothetical protein [Sphingobium yanoikuyae]|uniref:hypothetical protein n=1 Tax=Sphingobium yanoikuyae TaxID=13690 RepID=UPI00111315A9|nr:hypothetical protein [Sphingobium yanoikuyae]
MASCDNSQYLSPSHHMMAQRARAAAPPFLEEKGDGEISLPPHLIIPSSSTLLRSMDARLPMTCSLDAMLADDLVAR